MRLNSTTPFKHLSSVRHEGKVVIFAVTQTDQQILYTVRRDGFEDRSSNLKAQNLDWENWRPVPLPKESEDQSVTNREAESLSIPRRNNEPAWVAAARAITGKEAQLVRSLYTSDTLHADAAVQALSVLGHLYLFRAAKNGSILVDRYVLDGLTNTLVRKLDVRFKRSGMRHTPLENKGGAEVIDALDFRDINGKPFYEPTIELTLINRIKSGVFSVVLAPSGESDKHVWHIFTATGGNSHIELTSIRASADGLFDVTDAQGQPGIRRRNITIGKLGAPSVKINSVAAIRYDRQVKSKSRTGEEQFLRDTAHVLLTVNGESATKGIAAISFAITPEGQLAQASNASANDFTLRAIERNVVLRPGELQSVEAVTGAPALPSGRIAAWSRTGDGQTEIVLSGNGRGSLPNSGTIRISGAGGYNGTFQPQPATLGRLQIPLAGSATQLVLDRPLAGPLAQGSTVRIQRPVPVPSFLAVLSSPANIGDTTLRIKPATDSAGAGTPVEYRDGFVVESGEEGALGRWEALQAPPDDRKDVATIDGVALDETGLRIDARNVAINPGAQFEITNSASIDGVFSYSRVDDSRLKLERKWAPGRLLPGAERDRTGLQFEHPGDGVELPGLETLNFTAPMTFEVWVKTTSDGLLLSRFDPKGAWGPEAKAIAIIDGRAAFVSGFRAVKGSTVVADGKFHHVAAILRPSANSTVICDLVIDGVLQTLPAIAVAADTAAQRVQLGVANTPNFPLANIPQDAASIPGVFRGSLYDARLWNRALTRILVARNRDLLLSGLEDGLVGSWRLTSETEDTPPRTADFSSFRRDGIVRGDVAAGEATLSRSALAGRTVTGFEGADFFEVTEGATYVESFEFQLDAAVDKPFKFKYQGRRDLDSTALIDIAAGTATFAKPREGEPWISASCSFTVPEGTGLVRSFNIAEFNGAWTRMIVRKHRITEISDSIRESTLSEDIPLQTGDAQIDPAVQSEFAGLELSAGRLNRRLQLLNSLEAKIRTLTRALAHPTNYWCQIIHQPETEEGAVNAVSLQPGAAPTLVSPLGADGAAAASTLLRMANLTATGEGLRISDSGFGRMALISALNSTKSMVKSATNLDVTDEECPPCCLDGSAGPGLRGAVLLDPVGFEKLLTADLKKEFQAQVGETGRAMRTGIPRSQGWSLLEQGSFAPGIVGADGGINIERQIEVEMIFELDLHGDPGSITRLNITNNQVGTASQATKFKLRIPKIDLSEPPAKKEKEAGRPVSEEARRRLIRIKDQLVQALSEAGKLGLFPESGREALKSEIRGKLTALAPEIGPRRTTYLGTANTALQEMPVISPANAPTVRGLFLAASSVASSSRITPFETASGDVELVFAESERLSIRGRTSSEDQTLNRTRLRGLAMDSATSRWSGDLLPKCLNFNRERLNVSKLAVEAEWTIECWFFAPLSSSPLEHRFVELKDKSDTPIGLSAIEVNSSLHFGAREGGAGVAARDTVDTSFDVSLLEAGWHHLAIAARAGRTEFYVDGSLSGEIGKSYAGRVSAIGNDARNADAGAGRLAEVRVWGAALSQEEISANCFVPISGREPGLLAWFPLDGSASEASGSTAEAAFESVGSSQSLSGATEPFPRQQILKDLQGDVPATIVTGEYTTLGIDAKGGRTTAMMRRFYGYPCKARVKSADVFGAELLANKRVEELDLVWVSNAQFAPTLLGYIEGPPPVPSENLTVDPESYGGATSIALNQSTEIDFSWTRAKEQSQGASFNLFVGSENEITAGFGVISKAFEYRAGLTGGLSFAQAVQAESTVSASSTISTSDSLTLHGAVESEPRFPGLGRRFVPKNVGYALVISSIADVYITRLKRSKRMVDYSVIPVPDVPPQINTITFLINPAYVLNGSLDGLVGTSAADDVFYKQIPEMRARRGSLFPASYLRLKEAFDLKRQIEEQDKRRESYFANFDVTLALRFDSQDDEIEKRINTGREPGEISVNRQEAEGVPKPPAAATSQVDAKLDAIQENLRSQRSEREAQAQKKNEEIRQLIPDPDKQNHALQSFQAWQKRLEDLRIRAGKRNIVNSYVWDADGGLRSETQEFASTVEHTIGSSVTLDAGVGADFELGISAFKLELSASFLFSMTQTLSKTATATHSLALEVDTSGIERLGISDAQDIPLVPGEKVDRFRFMTFYLEGSTKNFEDFFSYVVDPRWLQSNDEEARALRQTQSGKPNAAWRVLHRVTSVERPALAGLGADTRAQRGGAALESLEDSIKALRAENQELKSKVEEIITLLGTKAKAAGV